MLMETAFNTNTKVFSDGMQMLEAQQGVVRQVLQDVLNGHVRVLKDDGSTPPEDGLTRRATIDFNGYLQAYIQGMAAAEEQAVLEESRQQKGVIASVDEDSPIIFGGETP